MLERAQVARAVAESGIGGAKMIRSLSLVTLIGLASGCAGVHLVVRDPGPIDAVAVAPISFNYKVTPVVAYEKANDIVESIREAGRLAVDPADPIVEPLRVATLYATVNRMRVHESVGFGLAGGISAARSAVRFDFTAYRVHMVLRERDRTLATAFIEVDEDFDIVAAGNPADRTPGLTLALRQLAGKLAAAVPLERRALPSGLAFLDTHHRLFRQMKDGDDASREYSTYLYFFPDLPLGWFSRMTGTGGDGVLLTRTPADWAAREAFPGDLLRAVDGHPVRSAAACDRYLSRPGPHDLELERGGQILHSLIGDPSGVELGRLTGAPHNG
jgi:hypothetical protein